MDMKDSLNYFRSLLHKNNLTSKETNLVVQHHIKCIPEILENLAKKLKINLPRKFLNNQYLGKLVLIFAIESLKSTTKKLSLKSNTAGGSRALVSRRRSISPTRSRRRRMSASRSLAIAINTGNMSEEQLETAINGVVEDALKKNEKSPNQKLITFIENRLGILFIPASLWGRLTLALYNKLGHITAQIFVCLSLLLTYFSAIVPLQGLISANLDEIERTRGEISSIQSEIQTVIKRPLSVATNQNILQSAINSLFGTGAVSEMSNQMTRLQLQLSVLLNDSQTLVRNSYGLNGALIAVVLLVLIMLATSIQMFRTTRVRGNNSYSNNERLPAIGTTRRSNSNNRIELFSNSN